MFLPPSFLTALDLKDNHQLVYVQLACMSDLQQTSLNLRCVTGLTLHGKFANAGGSLLHCMLSDAPHAQPAMRYLGLHATGDLALHTGCVSRLTNLQILVLGNCAFPSLPLECTKLSGLTRLIIIKQHTDMIVSCTLLSKLPLLARLNSHGK